MKRCFLLLIGLLVTPAIAEVSPFLSLDEYQSEYVEYSDDDVADDDVGTQEELKNTAPTPVRVSRQPASTASRSVASRGTAARTTPTSGTSTSGRASSGTGGRVVASRNSSNTTSRSASDSARSVSGRTTTSRTAVSPRTTATSSRTATTSAARTATAARAAATGRAGVGTRAATTSARATTSAAGARTSRAATLTTSGTSLYNRNSVSGTNVAATNSKSSKIGSRVPAIRVATSASVTDTAASTASTLAEMDSLAEMTDYCKSQYASCMDDYCNVLDDNQGRCSCSGNIKNYAKAESALKTATEELQDVAQKIQYIGLTTREIETLFTETEAESKMSTLPDNSQIKTSLDKLKDMLIEVRTGTATSDTTNLSTFGFNANGLLDFSFDSTGFDLSSFLGGGFGTNTSSVSNQRGEELYKTAVNRCKSAVLKSCTAQGVDANLVTNSYDLQIDKECILYERSLNDSNDEMVATIRNAKNVLQKARLLVAQQKNIYDMRGCINALDACMQDEFVCGTDYENCLDPTGRYIVNGEIVLGSQPGHPIDPSYVYGSSGTSAGLVMSSDICLMNLYRTWDIPGTECTIGNGNAWSANETLANYIEKTVTQTSANKVSDNMSEYLQNKIGYVDGDRNMGMCISVLNKCQDYTYTGSGTTRKYNPQNAVIQQYLARTLIQIKSKQDELLSNYADSCVSDVTSCLSQNSYDSTTSVSTTTNNLAINACRATIVTCMSVTGYSTDDPTPAELAAWVCGTQNPDSTDCDSLKSKMNGTVVFYVGTNQLDESTCLHNYSKGMNQMITCNPTGDSHWPENAVFVGWCTDGNLTDCTSGANVWIPATASGTLTYYAKWTCASGYELSADDGTCVKKEDNGNGGGDEPETPDVTSVTITFQTESGDVLNSHSCYTGKPITLPAAPNNNSGRECTFEGWKKDGTVYEENHSFTCPSTNTNFVAYWACSGQGGGTVVKSNYKVVNGTETLNIANGGASN